MRFVPSAIHSTPDSRRLLRLVDVLISSIVNMVLSRKVRNQVEVIEISTFFLCNEKLNVTRKIS